MRRLRNALFSACLLGALTAATSASAAPTWTIGIDHRNLYGVGGLTSPYSGSGMSFSRQSASNGYSVQITNTSLGAGVTLTCDPGSWSGSPTFSYQWYRNGAAIGGATSPSYVTTAGDDGAAIQCAATGSNGGGGSTLSYSQPRLVGSPVDEVGLPYMGSSVTASSDTQNGTQPSKGDPGVELTCYPEFEWRWPASFSYQWLKNGAPIAGQTTDTYTIQASDPPSAIQCAVTATNPAGSVTATSPAQQTVPAPSPAAPAAGVSAVRITGGNVVDRANGAIVVLSLPPGLEPAGSQPHGTGISDGGGFFTLANAANSPTQAFVAQNWVCALDTATCSREDVLEAGASYPPIILHVRAKSDAADMETPVVSVSGGGAPAVAASEPTEIAPAVPFGVAHFTAEAEDDAGEPYTQAGGHPVKAFTEIVANVEPRSDGRLYNAGGDPREVQAELPPGFSANPLNFAKCPQKVFASSPSSCDPDSRIGFINVSLPENTVDSVQNNGNGLVASPYAYYLEGHSSYLYNLEPRKGLPAQLAFSVVGYKYYLDATLRSDGDYGLTIGSATTPAQSTLDAVRVTACAHGVMTEFRPQAAFGSRLHSSPFPGGGFIPACAPTPPDAVPFLSFPSKCAGDAPLTTLSANSYQHSDEYIEMGAYVGAPSAPYSFPGHPTFANPVPESFAQGCAALTEQFSPSLTLQPDVDRADSPTGADVDLHIPQTNTQDTLAEPALKKAVVTLPEGMVMNAGAANGIGVCTTEQMGLIGTGFPPPNPTHFDKSAIRCPDSSKIGTLEVESPLLSEPLDGSVYLAAQGDNVFKSDFAVYLGVDDPKTGLVIKLPGKIDPNPSTGRVTVTFDNNPQVPVEHVRMHFFGGPQGTLATPQTCGEKAVTTQMVPWSAADPDNPAASEIATPTDTFTVSSSPNGGCASSQSQLPFNLGLTAGSDDPTAAAKTPLRMRITRPDGAQNIDKLELSPPPGFIGSLKGIPYCSEAQIAAISARSGNAEQQSSSCPAASQVGTTVAGAGSGSNPYYAPGKLYLAGPYKGETLSVVAVTPAIAGPLDLGNVVIRNALKIDPRTARITAVSDPIPQFVRGVPLRIRDIRINLDRPNWAQNPTNCDAMSVDATIYGTGGAVSKPSNRYQLGGCDKLGFKPKLSIHLKGGTKRGDHPALLATLTTRPGDANIARAAVTLPPSAFLDQGHIRTVCTRVQFAADACPKGAIYGTGKAVTSLLDDPIEGNVYLRSSDNKLPDLVAALKGVANVEAVGRIDSVKGGIRNTFDIVPDAPFDKFTLRMQGGKKGLVINSQNLCAKTHRATVKLTAHNGKRYNYRPKVIADGCKKGRKGKQRPTTGPQGPQR
jgi:hypothetical protein